MRLIVPRSTSTTYVAGEIPSVQAGDILLVRHHGIAASLIRASCRLRCPRGVSRKDWNDFCAVNHAAVALTTGGLGALVAQETVRGQVVSTLEQVDYAALGVVRLVCAPEQRASMLAFARDAVGTGYGFLQIPADLVNAATGLELALGFDDRMVCSTATCRAAERTGYVPDRSPECVTPPHLAWHFGVRVPKV